MDTEAIRLLPGADLKQELKRLARQSDMRAGVILSCVGSLSQASSRMPGATPDSEVVKSYSEPLEIVSLVGTISNSGIHVHISVARGDAQCVGGHLDEGCIVKTTAELVVGKLLDHEFTREVDSSTGFRELSVHKRPRREPEVGS